MDYRIVHTGQHYDRGMSDVFFAELGIPVPDYQLGAGGGTHAQQTANIMLGIEELCLQSPPMLWSSWVTSTRRSPAPSWRRSSTIPVAHIEAGLRSGDMKMPEEVNRIVTDAIADWLFVTEPSGLEHLRREGKADSAVFYVGNVMVDNLLYQRNCLSRRPLVEGVGAEFRRRHTRYGVVTLHRPSNVDDPVVLGRLTGALSMVAETLPLIFPVHPRTQAQLEALGIELGSGVTVCPPLGYMEFLSLWKDAVVVLTDSGGLQEETTALGVPCVTLRECTERPITVTEGTNVVVGTDPGVMLAEVERILRGQGKMAVDRTFGTGEPRSVSPGSWSGSFSWSLEQRRKGSAATPHRRAHDEGRVH